jgi:hypothetical protein
MFTQNDPSVYAKAQTAKEKLSDEKIKERTSKTLAELEKHSVQTVIDAFRNGYNGVKLPVNLMLL